MKQRSDSMPSCKRMLLGPRYGQSPNATIESPTYVEPYRKYPKIDLKLRAPIELENLLPYNVQYRIYDKDTDQNWKSYLRTGGIMPVHSVELGHLVLLNIEVQDTGRSFTPVEYAMLP